MSNINLEMSTDDAVREKESLFGGGVIVTFLIFLLVLGAYAFIFTQKKMVESKIQTTKDEYKLKSAAFIKGQANDVIDFQNRSAEAKALMANDVTASSVFRKIEETILAPVHLNSFEYDKEKRKILLECVCPNYNAAAKQVLSFKESGYFSDIFPNQSAIVPEKNELVYKIELTLK